MVLCHSDNNVIMINIDLLCFNFPSIVFVKLKVLDLNVDLLG